MPGPTSIGLYKTSASRTCFLRFMAASLPLLSFSRMYSQAVTATPSQGIQRDQAAMGIVQTALSKMNPKAAAALVDLKADWAVTTWQGRSIAGTLHEEAAGPTYRTMTATLNDGTTATTTHLGLIGVEQFGAGSSRVGDERNLQQIVMTPGLLLEEALGNTRSSLESIAADADADECLKVGIRDSTWTASFPNRGIVRMRACFDHSSGLLTKVTMLQRTDGDPTHVLHEEIAYADYESAGDWLLPHSETVSFSGRKYLAMHANKLEINAGVHATLPNLD